MGSSGRGDRRGAVLEIFVIDLRHRRAKKSHCIVLNKGVSCWHGQREVGSCSLGDREFQSCRVARESWVRAVPRCMCG